MTSSKDIGTQLRRARRTKQVKPHPVKDWDWGPREPPNLHRKLSFMFWFVIILTIAVVLIPSASAQSEKGKGQSSVPKTTTTTTMPPPPPPTTVVTTTTSPPPQPTPEPVMTLAPPPPISGVTVGGHLPDWGWDSPGNLSVKGMAAMALAVGCDTYGAAVAAAVGQWESGGRTDAVGDTTLMDNKWSYSAGAWQIRGLHAEHNTYQIRDPQALLHDMWHNAKAMYSISGSCGEGWSHWTVWRLRKHEQTMREAVDAVLWLKGMTP